VDTKNNKMEKIVSLCKRRGFIFPSSEIYGGLAGSFDWGPLGVRMVRNIESLWWKMFVDEREDVFPLDSSIILNPKVWEASGHVAGFADPLESGEKFNVMFKTSVGAGDEAISSYLRPETAQGIFINFKNVIDSFHPKIPFGIAQVGKAFRNEIAPRDFIFRKREFEQMEIEYFVKPNGWKDAFEEWRSIILKFASKLGLKNVHELEVPDEERAHYSKRTIDFEFDFPFGRKELWGLAYRTDFDLTSHAGLSGEKLEYLDEETKESFVPHVVEPSLGVDRTVLAVLVSAYSEDKLGEEERIFLKLPYEVAPIKAAVFPLLKNKPDLVKKAKEVHLLIKKLIPNCLFDDNGNIGKRYRRQDEIGTPFCVTIDFETLDNDSVTLRDRDTGEQKRVDIKDLLNEITKQA